MLSEWHVHLATTWRYNQQPAVRTEQDRQTIPLGLWLSQLQHHTASWYRESHHILAWMYVTSCSNREEKTTTKLVSKYLPPTPPARPTCVCIYAGLAVHVTFRVCPRSSFSGAAVWFGIWFLFGFCLGFLTSASKFQFSDFVSNSVLLISPGAAPMIGNEVPQRRSPSEIHVKFHFHSFASA